MAQATLEQIDKRRRGEPVAGWRQVFELVVRWRQVSEPNDQVVWVDKLTRKEFEAGFGSHTPMLSGPTKVHVIDYPTNVESCVLRVASQTISYALFPHNVMSGIPLCTKHCPCDESRLEKGFRTRLHASVSTCASRDLIFHNW